MAAFLPRPSSLVPRPSSLVPRPRPSSRFALPPLAVACSLGIAVIFKLAERRDYDRTALLTVNYAAAAVLALALVGAEPPGRLDAGLVALGVAEGVLFIAGFWLFSLAIRQAGMGIAAGVMRLSVVVPVLVSWAIWREAPTALQLVGLALGGVAFFLIARPAAEAPGKLGPPAGEASPDDAAPPARGAVAVLAALFLCGGLVDVCLKAFDVGYGDAVPTSTFLLFVFGVAFALGLAVVVRRGLADGVWPSRAVVEWGVVLGLVNYASADFILRAVAALSGPVVFPANSVSIVLGAALVGRFVWGERLTRANLAGLGVAAVALVCLVG